VWCASFHGGRALGGLWVLSPSPLQSFSNVQWFDASEPRREGRGPLRYESRKVIMVLSVLDVSLFKTSALLLAVPRRVPLVASPRCQ
jgi:hypothetical protein